jgi:hypothetical protein
MVNTRSRALALGLIGAAALAGAAAKAAMDETGFVRVQPEEVRWRPDPSAPGVETALLAGDPSGTGLYVIRVKFPPHVMDRPHWHPNARYVTVMKGTWCAGTGDRFDPAAAVRMKPGAFMLHPARAAHWDGSCTDEEVIVQIVGMGPADTTPLDPKQAFWVKVGG